jgi:hypothetical protein
MIAYFFSLYSTDAQRTDNPDVQEGDKKSVGMRKEESKSFPPSHNDLQSNEYKKSIMILKEKEKREALILENTNIF